MNYNREMKNTVLAALAFVAVALPSAAADISGSWTFTGETWRTIRST